jgi:hypothetical protein
MWMLFLLLVMQVSPNPCQSSPAQAQSPSLIVQVVDPDWLPVLGAHVTVKPLRGDAQIKSSQTETDEDGYAKFFVPGDADYEIEVESYGFKRERVKPLHLFKASGSSARAYGRLRCVFPGLA